MIERDGSLQEHPVFLGSKNGYSRTVTTLRPAIKMYYSIPDSCCYLWRHWGIFIEIESAYKQEPIHINARCINP